MQNIGGGVKEDPVLELIYCDEQRRQTALYCIQL